MGVMLLMRGSNDCVERGIQLEKGEKNMMMSLSGKLQWSFGLLNLFTDRRKS